MNRYAQEPEELQESGQSEDFLQHTKGVFVETNRTSRLNFLNLLVKEVPYDYKLKKLKTRKSPHDQVNFEIDDGHRFRNTVAITKTGTTTIQALSSSSRNSGVRDYLKKKQLENEIRSQFEKEFGGLKRTELMPVELVSWEECVCETSDDVSVSTKEYVNGLLEGGWEKYVFTDLSKMPADKPYLTLYIDDPNLIFEKIEEKKVKIKRKPQKVGSYDKPLKNKYNIGNDKYYVSEVKSKVSLGTFGVQHSLPALKLDPRFYKTNHTKEELRAFHRMPLVMKGTTFAFKAPSAAKFNGNIIKKANELSLLDSTPFKVFEYFEEFPFFAANPGMVSLMNTYYRKLDSLDEPAADGCIVLDVDDDAPFFGFGNVKAGTYVTTLANNLFIAPIAEHKSGDFLCVVEDGEITMRPIEAVQLIGQEFPKEEVFVPHSRKLNQFCKDRLKVAAYRIFAKGKDLMMQQLDQMFPYFSEGSKRKWLKEYSDCVKKGKENVWSLKDSFSIVGEEDLRKLVTPENICQYESMLSAERRMQDLGYKCLDEDDEDEYEAYSPSWYLSRNFVNAANGKGLLELSGPADPSGTGEAFSFRKIRLKKGNDSENRKIIAEHQSTYKERGAAIWSKHIAMLASTELVEHVPEQTRATPDVQSEATGTDSATLVIRRTIEHNGEIQVKIEKLYDSRVINAYLKVRKTIKIEEKKSSLTCSSCGQLGHMKTNKTCPNYVGSVKPTKKKSEEKRASLVFQEKLSKLVSVFISVPFSNAFHRPVSHKKFPNYATIVKNPIDLTTIKTRVKSGAYSQFSEFLDALGLMRDNCAQYNGNTHSLTEIASDIYNQAKQYYENNEAEIKELERLISDEKRETPRLSSG